jgi:hypothetical protein
MIFCKLYPIVLFIKEEWERLDEKEKIQDNDAGMPDASSMPFIIRLSK